MNEIWIPITNRNISKDVEKISKTIKSCKLFQHLDASENMIMNFHKLHNQTTLTQLLMEQLNEKRNKLNI